jgi:hypothetical protein
MPPVAAPMTQATDALCDYRDALENLNGRP